MAPDDPVNPQNSDPSGNALGFSEGQAQKKPERYNTQFLVANFEKEERRTRFIVIGVVVAVLVAGGVGLMMTSHEEPKPQAAKEGEPAPGTPKAPLEKKPEAAPAPKAEAPKDAAPPKPADAPK